MRLTEFWIRMDQHFGRGYSKSWAHDQHLAELGGLSVEQALAGDWEARDVWRAVWRHEGMPLAER
ncbi:MAG: DUF3046 domain-containing protein [Actinobacteria bacterium]|nr:DUF3046 domain-containing protein [Actinomycetota bacterium]